MRAYQADSVRSSTAFDTLVHDGFAKADVEAAIDSLIDAGLEIDEQDDDYDPLFTRSEFEVVRIQLRGVCPSCDKALDETAVDVTFAGESRPERWHRSCRDAESRDFAGSA